MEENGKSSFFFFFTVIVVCFCSVLFCCLVVSGHAAQLVGILVPQPGIKPMPPAVEARSPNRWTVREVPENPLIRILILWPKQRTPLGYLPNECRWAAQNPLVVNSQGSTKTITQVFPFTAVGTQPCSLLYLMLPFMQHKNQDHRHLCP